jgi:hypothetical protein
MDGELSDANIQIPKFRVEERGRTLDLVWLLAAL